MRIVFLSHTSRQSVFRVGSHHLAREFSRLGHHVAHISNPISVAHLARFTDPEVRARARRSLPLRLQCIDGAHFVVPWSVFPLAPDPLAHPLTLGSTRMLRKSLIAAGFDRPELMFVDQPLLDYLIEPLDPQTVIYRPTDIVAGKLAQTAQLRVLRRSAGVVATSAVVAAQLPEVHPRKPSVVVENGVDTEHFVPSSIPWSARSGAVYVGALDARFDWTTVDAIGQAHPSQRVDLYGPVAQSPPRLPPNVTLRGAVPYEDLPSILRTYRIGLLPMNHDPANDGRSPMKLFEYLASGLSVVARKTSALSAHELADLHMYGTSETAPNVFGTALTVAATPAGVAAANEMGWTARANRVLSAAEEMREQAPRTIGRIR